MRFKREIVVNYLLRNNLTIKSFCRQNGVDIRSFNKLMRMEYDVDVRLLFQISKAIGLKVHLLFEKQCN